MLHPMISMGVPASRGWIFDYILYVAATSFNHNVGIAVMKYLFLVSSINRENLSKGQNIYLADTYLKDIFLDHNKTKIKFSDNNRKTKDDLLIHQKYIDNKCDIYTEQIAKLLNRYHGRKYNTTYWSKCFNLNFKRFLTLTHDAYLTFNKFNDNEHTAKILDKELYYVPTDFGDACNFIKGNEFATEQLFSIYLELFYPMCSLELFQHEYKNTDNQLNLSQKIQSLLTKLKRLTEKNLIIEALKIILRIRHPKIAIIHSFFSYKSMNKLFLKSLGLIQSIPINIHYNSANEINYEHRNHIFNDFLITDNFDKYILTTLKIMMPRLYVEDYRQMEEKCLFISNRFTKLKYIFCEAFQSDDCLSLFLALCKTRGIKHIYNEHNFISHIYCGNNAQRLADMCDKYITVGWDDKNYFNTEKGASLFQFDTEEPYSPSNQILYISHFIPVKRLDYFGGYSQMFAEGGTEYIDFQNNFFDKLNKNVMDELVYRGYPQKEMEKYIVRDDLLSLKIHLRAIKYIDDHNLTAKQMINKSKLTIISYISTSVLEVLIMNVPSIIFLNRATNPLLDRYQYYFDDLTDAGICHPDPQKAAEFVNTIYPDGVEVWWWSKKVQDARKTFLYQNIGKPNEMIDYIFKLSN